MALIKIKFLEAGKWGDHPADPIFEVEEGEEREVSASLARIATDAGKAEYVRPKQRPGPKPKAEPEKVEKPKAGPRKKAETGPNKKAES